jgi:hypothetical protein
MHSHTCFVLDRKKAIRRYMIGNVAEQDLTDIWNEPGFVAFRRRVLQFEFSPCVSCGGCEMADATRKTASAIPSPPAATAVGQGRAAVSVIAARRSPASATLFRQSGKINIANGY